MSDNRADFLADVIADLSGTAVQRSDVLKTVFRSEPVQSFLDDLGTVLLQAVVSSEGRLTLSNDFKSTTSAGEVTASISFIKAKPGVLSEGNIRTAVQVCSGTQNALDSLYRVLHEV